MNGEGSFHIKKGIMVQKPATSASASPKPHPVSICLWRKGDVSYQELQGTGETSDALGCSSLQLALNRRALGDEEVSQ